MLRAAEAEAQAEAARALIGADMGPDVNRVLRPLFTGRETAMVASPWGQIWVTDFGAGQGGFVGHGGSRFAPGSNGERIMKRKFIARRMAYWIS